MRPEKVRLYISEACDLIWPIKEVTGSNARLAKDLLIFRANKLNRQGKR